MRARVRIDRVLPGKPTRPARSDTLNLADLDPAIWHVMDKNKAHGPFTLGQLQAFADAGKVGPLTRISSGDGEPFLPALDHPPLRARIEVYLASRATRRAEASNFVILSGPGTGDGGLLRNALASALNGLGRFAEPMPGTFVLRSDRPLAEVRRAVFAAAPQDTAVLIFESREARLGWTGLSMQGAEGLRAVWDAPINPPAE
ncbi:MAG: DUF4339 domain-containing protein [Hyphomonas sp.]|uniref:GYF domain-containing protein n=1 Tax=Hyphomonas sp. TaxID=87 RepID=UPI001796DAD4|nr:GYF domain-containing protein [Hyphomonas sp.]MBU3919600.1 DUF4339 domain-containing protein [Alphaproteobacteria bacterium]MBA3069094.1 DUF4339 domain-containing protein [Hyphomonas sp.]MBU4063567.1 DUF4339 domain-containing protein [Alphaproteobacteria bacterium]MBU4165046.1 DUF4339 domain-containing protein [Alphaproteobacteria bacterium]MBU4567446.1 DUF4339 domain-containing protein [Alphaproteobacteria bacterium]